MELGEPDNSGRRRPVPIKNSEFVLEVDFVIVAIGQFPEVGVLKKEGIKTDKKEAIVTDSSYVTNIKGVFAAGDVVTGAATAGEAIAGGKKAAISIDKYLRGEALASFKVPFTVSKGEIDEINKNEFEKEEIKPRQKMSELSLEERLNNFKEIELGLSEEQVRKEADRCLKCGCEIEEDCVLRKYGIEYEVDLKKFKECKKHKYSLDLSHTKISRDPNKCIRCGRCARICIEIKKIGALGFVNRGFEAIIAPPFGDNLAWTKCDGCGECVISCPTAALYSKEFPKK